MELGSIDYTESPCKPHWYIIYSISEVFVHWYYFFKTRYWNYLILVSTFFIRKFLLSSTETSPGVVPGKGEEVIALLSEHANPFPVVRFGGMWP